MLTRVPPIGSSVHGGTKGSNPPPSSGESGANSIGSYLTRRWVGQVAPRHDQPRARAAVRHRRGRRDETIISFRTKDDPIVVPAGRNGVGKMLVAGAVEVDAGKPRRPAEGDRGLWQGPDPRFCPRRSGPTDPGGDGRLAAMHPRSPAPPATASELRSVGVA